MSVAPANSAQPRVAREVMRFVLGYWRRLPLRMSLMLLGVGVGVLLEVQVPEFAATLTRAVETWLLARAAGDEAAAGAWSGARDAAVALALLFALVFTVKQLYLRNWMVIAAQTMRTMVDEGFQRVQRFSADWHANHFAGSTVRKISRGMWAYDTLADTVVVELGPAFGLLFGLSLAMLLRDTALGLYFVFAVTGFLTVSIWLSLSYVAPANLAANEADTELGGALADAVTCNATVKSFGAESREDARLAGVTRSWAGRAQRSWLRSMDAGAVQSLMLIVMLGGLLTIVLAVPGAGGVRVEDVVYVIATYLMVNSYMRNIGWQIRNAQRSINELEDLTRIAATVPQIADAPAAAPFRPGAGEIVFDSVDFGYANQPGRLFKGLSLRIEPGEKVALVGESGSGKSTLVKLLQRLYDVDGGAVRVDGQDVGTVTQASLRRAISVVPQDPILFHRTLLENIAYAHPHADEAQIRTAAAQAHADRFIERLQSDYDTLVGERGIKLSGGERQRVAIARALLADARILVLDEATSSLDAITERLIQDALEQLMRGRTAIVIAHRLSTVRKVDRVLVFDAGRIVESGTHDSLIQIENGHYRRLVEMQTLTDDDAQAA